MTLDQQLQTAGLLCAAILIMCGIGWIILKTLNASRGDGE